jgi:phosphatidylglycerol:prolipoprotein diacylglycerol transferase
MRRILFSLGPLQINSFGLLVALGMLAAFFLIYLESRRKRLDEDKVFNFALWILILGIVGARLGYIVVAGPAAYLQHPLSFFYLRDGGMSIHGALAGGLLAAIVFSRLHRMSFWQLADLTAPALALGIAIGRVGCDVFGRPMAHPWFWGVPVNGQLLHPAQVYEFLLDYLLFLYLWRRRKKLAYNGQLFIHFAVLYALIRGSVEFSRFNPRLFGPFSVAHAACLVLIIAAALAGWILKSRRQPVLAAERPQAVEHGLIGKFTDSLSWQIGIISLAIVLSLAVFYGFGP